MGLALRAHSCFRRCLHRPLEFATARNCTAFRRTSTRSSGSVCCLPSTVARRASVHGFGEDKNITELIQFQISLVCYFLSGLTFPQTHKQNDEGVTNMRLLSLRLRALPLSPCARHRAALGSLALVVSCSGMAAKRPVRTSRCTRPGENAKGIERDALLQSVGVGLARVRVHPRLADHALGHVHGAVAVLGKSASRFRWRLPRVCLQSGDSMPRP